MALPHDAKKAREAGFKTLTDGLAEYLSRCKNPLWFISQTSFPSFHFENRSSYLLHLGQSFEGGISGSPGVEAHGAYAFCALACLSILGPPEETIPRYGVERCNDIPNYDPRKSSITLTALEDT